MQTTFARNDYGAPAGFKQHALAVPLFPYNPGDPGEGGSLASSIVEQPRYSACASPILGCIVMSGLYIGPYVREQNRAVVRGTERRKERPRYGQQHLTWAWLFPVCVGGCPTLAVAESRSPRPFSTIHGLAVRSTRIQLHPAIS
jgi:hypothetical protein